MANNKREKATIRIAEHPEFPTTNDSSIMTSHTLSKYVNALFSGVFADYKGCRIYADQSQDPNAAQLALSIPHPVQLELYFALGVAPTNGDQRVLAFRQITDAVKDKYQSKGKMNYLEMVMGYNVAITQNKSSEITQDAIEILQPMLWAEVARQMNQNPTPADFNKKGVVVEASTNAQQNYGQPQAQKIVYSIINFVDINAVLNLLFSSSDDTPFWYNVVPIKPIIPSAIGYMTPNLTDQKWLFSVNRLNQQNLYDVCNDLGQFNAIGGLNIYTDSL